MGRKKLEIKKSVDLTIRIEPTMKKKYLSFCKKNKFVLSKRIREFIEKEME